MTNALPRSVTTRSRIATIVLAALAAACSSPLTENQPLPGDQPTLELGGELYLAHCAECHGADLRGSDRGPSHLSEVYVPSHHGDAAFSLAVLRGVRQHHWRFGDMPPVEGLDEDAITAIVAYVRSVQEREGFEPYPP